MGLVSHHIANAVFAVANRWEPFGKLVTKLLVNNLVSKARRRPHPFSTLSDYTSWRSLTDMTWSGRHLPPKKIPNLPETDRVAALFPAADGKQELSNKSTLLFPFFAQYLTDGVIRTIMPDTSEGDSDELRKQNTSNHWVDLCSLYGRNREQTLALRMLSQEPGMKGKLKSQSIDGEEFAPFLFDNKGEVKEEFKILDPVLGLDNAPPDKRKKIFAFGGDRTNLSPMVAMLNTLFLREHNRLAGLVESDNPNWDEERVFEVSRNIIIAMFLKIVIEEYLNHISSQSLILRAYPSIAWTAPWNRPNWITTEFSLFYRWHSLVPATIKWNGKPLPIQDTLFDNELLIKHGLVGTFEEASSQPATKLKLRNMSAALAIHEVRGINQGRLCELAPYTDYCEYFSLDSPQLWSDFSADPVVVDKLKELYESPEHVEFYIGAFAGETTLNSPLPEFMLRLAAVDAFSQALNNPLLSEHVWNENTFTKTGWDTIQNTSSLKDVVTRVSDAKPANFIGMTQPEWKREAPPSVLLTALKETFDLRKSKAGRFRLAAFVITTIAEAVGLIFWLNLVGQDRNFQGFLWLVGGEAVEWAALAYMIAKSPLSYPKKQGHVGRSLVTSGLTSLSEAFLWVGWLLLIPVYGIWWASLALLIAMHAKHVTEMTIFTGKRFFALAFDERDITASIIEVAGAVIWFSLVMAGYPVIGGIILFVMLFLEHILQFQTAGFLKESDE